VLKQQKGSPLFDDSIVEVVPETQATAAEIAARMKKIGRKVKPNDWFVLFLSGYGFADEEKPGSFFYVCADSDRAKADSVLTSRRLDEVLMGIRGRKLIILDTSSASAVVGDPIPALTRDGFPC
jgi:hypothetical protein